MDGKLRTRIRKLKLLLKKGIFYSKDRSYYISIRKESRERGIRFFHRNKYKGEIVDLMTSKNICPFVLFSNRNDCILHLALNEDRLLKLKKQNKGT